MTSPLSNTITSPHCLPAQKLELGGRAAGASATAAVSSVYVSSAVEASVAAAAAAAVVVVAAAPTDSVDAAAVGANEVERVGQSSVGSERFAGTLESGPSERRD